MRKAVVRLITFVAGVFFVLEFLLPARIGGVKNPLTACLGGVTNFVVVVGAMAFLLGPVNLARSHITALVRRHKTWLESAVFLAFLAAGLLAAALKGPSGRDVLARLYNALLFGLQMGFWATSMGILTFYLASAAYRAFRVNTLDSGLMMASAVIVLLGQVSLGDWLTQRLPHWLQLRAWTQWIIMVPNMAVHRAVLLGACAGAFAAGLRMWLGIGTRD